MTHVKRINLPEPLILSLKMGIIMPTLKVLLAGYKLNFLNHEEQKSATWIVANVTVLTMGLIEQVIKHWDLKLNHICSDSISATY